ncbi:MAG: sulfite exporter TauE/SafE family protein, partial [Micrococcales bacterium]|nr:sulfite exporter TauE/SafE family protein [Micrococcales bacterium]
MTLLVVAVLGVLIGAVLGALGGGGAALTVPALVYVVGQSAQAATTSSLVIVGLSAAVGMSSYISSRRVEWKVGVGFAVAGVPSAFVGTYFNHRVDQDVLLTAFAALMVPM